MLEKYVVQDHLQQFEDCGGSEILDRRHECLRFPLRYYDCAATFHLIKKNT